MTERDRYSIVVANSPSLDSLVVELAIGEDILFEFFIEDGHIKLAIYAEEEKPTVITDAHIFLKAMQDAFQDALTIPD